MIGYSTSVTDSTITSNSYNNNKKSYVFLQVEQNMLLQKTLCEIT
jgi:hypothetical protein